jgi:outer membrane lipoprotein-sorting protein
MRTHLIFAYFSHFFILFFCLLNSTFGVAANLHPDEILRKADEIRNPSESYLMEVELNNGIQGDNRSVFEVAIQGNHKTLIKTLEPLRDRGRNMLMLDENMWAFIPNLNRSVRVSLSQKLTGQAANGDISRMRWSGDYQPQIETDTPQDWVLFLSSVKKGLTYEKLRVWIDKKTYFPKKAQYLTLDGKILKNVSYEEPKELAGKLRPSIMKIQDAIRPDEVSIIHVNKMQVKTFPASLMNQNSLR